MLAGAGQFILIALATLPLAGIPFAVWLYLDYRHYIRRRDQIIERRLHQVSP